jgi:hypothetical protein
MTRKNSTTRPRPATDVVPLGRFSIFYNGKEDPRRRVHVTSSVICFGDERNSVSLIFQGQRGFVFFLIGDRGAAASVRKTAYMSDIEHSRLAAWNKGVFGAVHE